MPFHRQPVDRKENMAKDIREWVQRISDSEAKLESLGRLSTRDLTDLMLAVHAADSLEYIRERLHELPLAALDEICVTLSN